MLRKSMVLGASALLLAGLMPALAPASAAPLPGLATAAQPKDDNRYVNLDDPASFRAVEPDVKAQGNGGRRIEIYSSVGDNEGGMDWRTINAFSYLVNSVPKEKNSYTTLFNSLYDFPTVIPQKTATGKWNITSRSEVFAPTAAFLNQVNLYDTEAERKQFIHVLGAKESMDEAWDAKSSLARLVQAGSTSKKTGQRAVDYLQCPGDGGCLSGPDHLMHSKYGAFEQARDSDGNLHSNVVWMTSSNLNGSSGSKKSNISIAIYDDKKAYDAVVNDIFEPSVRVAKGEKYTTVINSSPGYKAAITPDSSGVIPGMATDSGVTLYPSPRRSTSASDYTTSTDVEAAFLEEQVTKSTSKPGCKVYAVHSLFNSTRNGVKDGLGKLHDQGCDVRIVLGDNAISDIVDGYFNMSSNLRELVGRVEFANVHDKTLSYKHSGTAAAFGGASNFTGTSLEYDELAFKADNLSVTNAVQDHSERVYQLAKGQVTWTTPSSVDISPSGVSKVRIGGTPLTLSPRVSPSNALVSKTTWSVASEGGAATVSPEGVVTGTVPGRVKVTVKVEGPSTLGKTPVTRTKTVSVDVVTTGASTEGAGGRANVPPTLSMDNYQSPDGNTDIVVTWGSGDEDYRGAVKLQYYSGGWKTYSRYITTDNRGVGKMSVNFKGSKTWRAYGARLDRINGKDVPNSTAKTKSKWSVNTVRTKTTTSTPRLYATNLAKKSSKVPFLLSWNRSGGVVRLQMRSSGGSWKTHSSYRMGGSQEFISIPIANTKYWRLATSTGSTKVSNTVKVSMR